MKKHLIAAAVAAAVAVPAMAQQVTVYGIIDVGYQSYDNGTENITRSTNNALATSRLGFRGSEDLGGGLKANFQLEGTLNASEGGMGSTTANQTFNREAWAGLSGGFGEVRIGRQDVTYAQDMDSGSSQAGNLVFTKISGQSGELGGDQNGVIKYISPKFSGFNVELGYTAGNATGANVDANASQTGAFLQYQEGPLRAMLGWQKNDNAVAALEQDMKRLAASYDFGVASVGYVYTKSDVNAAGDVKFHTISARVPLSNGVALHGIYGKGEVETVANAKGDGYTLAVTKALSKRTTVYGAYTAVDNSAAGTFEMTGTSAPAAGQDTDAITIGLVHSF